MVHHHRQFKEPMDPRRNPNLIFTTLFKPLALFHLFILFSLIYCTLLFFPRLVSHINLDSSPTIPPSSSPPCSSIPNNTLCCDATAFRSDVCSLRGDVRTHSPTNSIFLHLPPNSTAAAPEQRIRPYTRKWEAATMATIDELRLRYAAAGGGACDVRHDVPAVVFSTGGYTGNVYHEFNDGILPLYITAERFGRRVVLLLLEYHDWWVTKYADVLSRISDFAPVDFSGDSRIHCFPEAIVGLRIHDELSIDPARMANNKTIVDFRRMLDEAYRPRIRVIEQETIQSVCPTCPSDENKTKQENIIVTESAQKPKLVIVSRNGSRAIENEAEVARVAEEVGFRVEVVRPAPTMELAKIYRALNACDAMFGVHGAAMTHFLFMRPGKVFIQVVPLGTDWAAESYYGAPAVRLGLKYVRYRVHPRESSLYRAYKKDDPVLRDPDSVNAKGWETTKKVYLDGQSVRLDLERIRKRLDRAHQYLVSKKGKSWNQ